MLSTSNLLEQCKIDFPQIRFANGDDFVWSTSTQTITYRALRSADDISALLHELAHAILDHQNFTSDIELVKKETEAWHYAATVLGQTYHHSIDDDALESQLNTYRDWLHQRSLCPNCEQTSLQTQTSHYSCFNCGSSWRVNDARRCALRRYAAN